jgi:hypothetical protein
VNYADSRTLNLEELMRDLARAVNDLTARVKRLEDKMALVGGGGGTGGGGTGAFVSTPSGSVAAGGSLASQTVKSVSGGVETSLPGTFTLYNQMGSAAVASKKCNLIPDGAGGYVIYSQSCA